MIRTRRLQAHPERSPDQAAAMWYERMARYLARRGVQKSTTQTAQEFVRVIEDERVADASWAISLTLTNRHDSEILRTMHGACRSCTRKWNWRRDAKK